LANSIRRSLSIHNVDGNTRFFPRLTSNFIHTRGFCPHLLCLALRTVTASQASAVIPNIPLFVTDRHCLRICCGNSSCAPQDPSPTWGCMRLKDARARRASPQKKAHADRLLASAGSACAFPQPHTLFSTVKTHYN